MNKKRVITSMAGERRETYKYDVERNSTMGKLVLKGGHELEIRSLCRGIIQKDWTVFDVGANDGIHTVLFSDLVGENGCVYAFEPVKRCIKRLTHNLSLNNCRNVTIIRSIAWHKTGTAQFYEFNKYRTNSSAVLNEKVIKRADDVAIKQMPAITLDDFIKNHKPPDFIKIDTEGGELNILQGAKRVLRHTRPFIIMEYYRKRLRFLGITGRRFRNILRDYDTYEIAKRGRAGGFILSPFKFNRALRHNNVFCIPKDQKSLVLEGKSGNTYRGVKHLSHH